ncbi:MAG: hypothetical protein QOD93_4640, partial [Acetobacteraceae bacterium]|nr:hypothetical protein [Acetobacteraceae bacterium]
GSVIIRASVNFLEVDDNRSMTYRAVKPLEKGLSYGTDYYVEAVNLRPIEPFMEYGDNDFGAAGAMIIWDGTAAIRVLPSDERQPTLYFLIDNGKMEGHHFSDEVPAFAIFDWQIRILSPLDNVEPPIFAFSVALPDLP